MRVKTRNYRVCIILKVAVYHFLFFVFSASSITTCSPEVQIHAQVVNLESVTFKCNNLSNLTASKGVTETNAMIIWIRLDIGKGALLANEDDFFLFHPEYEKVLEQT